MLSLSSTFGECSSRCFQTIFYHGVGDHVDALPSSRLNAGAAVDTRSRFHFGMNNVPVFIGVFHDDRLQLERCRSKLLDRGQIQPARTTHRVQAVLGPSTLRRKSATRSTVNP
uniref:(northern house mosquito) hypothetical protein n=1 Tax=Culex pipiens TaxID=7175 RepID=A0A8D8DI16_CULPI